MLKIGVFFKTRFVQNGVSTMLFLQASSPHAGCRPVRFCAREHLFLQKRRLHTYAHVRAHVHRRTFVFSNSMFQNWTFQISIFPIWISSKLEFVPSNFDFLAAKNQKSFRGQSFALPGGNTKTVCDFWHSPVEFDMRRYTCTRPHSEFNMSCINHS